MSVFKIVSGGQAGADRDGLDAAIACTIPHGGWCPKGRKALDGALPSHYQLQETPSADYPQRTEWNVRDSDGTVIFILGAVLSGGSLKTSTLAKKRRKPLLHISRATKTPVEALRGFITQHSIGVLNVAGSRESKEPGLYAWTLGLLTQLISTMSSATEYPASSK